METENKRDCEYCWGAGGLPESGRCENCKGLGIEPQPKPTGDELRDSGVGLVLAHTSETAKEAIRSTIERLAATGKQFTSDDARTWLERDPLTKCVVEGVHPNAIGASFNAAKSQGLIRPCGYCKSVRPEAHSRIIRVWIKS